jgi:AcrR family transcriptional regulator
MMSQREIRPRQRGPKALLSRESIVLAALKALREGGPVALTMRGVAARLDTGPASLYAWVRNQRELHVLVLDAIASEVELPDEAYPPERQLVQLLLNYAERLFAYRGAAQLAIAAQPTGPAHLDLLERCLGLLEAAGVPQRQAAPGLDTLVLLITATIAEQDTRETGEGPETIPDLYEAAIAEDPSHRPRLAAGAALLRTLDGSERLAESIRIFLRGLAG